MTERVLRAVEKWATGAGVPAPVYAISNLRHKVVPVCHQSAESQYPSHANVFNGGTHSCCHNILCILLRKLLFGLGRHIKEFR